MANISVTQRCNRSCSYCFAQDAMRVTDRDGAFMTVDDFVHSLDFVERSGLGEVRLLGGEPTIHPQFIRFVDLAIERGLRVLVLTGGVVPEPALRHLEHIAPDRLSVMMNVIPPDTFTLRERTHQANVMTRLSAKVVLGLNIDSPGTPLDFLLAWIDEYGLQRTVRLGLAHPIAGAPSAYLSAQHYPAVGRRVADFFGKASEASIGIEFDCGWVPCMFPDGFIEQAGITPQDVGLRCNPILDVLPGRNVIACYPMATIAADSVRDDDRDGDVAGRLTQQLSAYRPLKLYKHCDSCAFFQAGTCLGGCIAGAMTRLRTAMPAAAVVA